MPSRPTPRLQRGVQRLGMFVHIPKALTLFSFVRRTSLSGKSPVADLQGRTLVRQLRFAALVFALFACRVTTALAQTPHFIFTVAPPEQAPSGSDVQPSAVIAERGLALWTGAVPD